MKSVREVSNLLASLVVFREIFDKQKDIYGVIAEFLKEIISVNGKHRFSETEITNLLNNTFDFSLPEAVVSTALRRLDLQREKGYYIVPNSLSLSGRQLTELQERNLSNNAELITNLVSFIESEKGHTLSDDEKTEVVRSFCSFLLDDTNVTGYSEYISGFTIKNKNDGNFTKSLNKIREGVILYSGIKYSNLGEIGTWQTNLTIYLDTEILFHFAGYNGKLYKSLFEDFFNYVKEINSRAKKIIIKLEYFKEVKDEIEQYFTKAEYIVEGKDRFNPRNTAMASVIEGCHTPSDVVSKKSDFYLLLKNNNIIESSKINYFGQENHKFNIADSKLIKCISDELGTDITDNLTFLNYVSILRKEDFLSSFENIGYILLTGNTLTIKIAFHEKIKPDGVVPLATSLNWITNKFWFKLNKGFGDGNFPASFDIITKAQMVLSSVLNKSIGEKFDELQAKFKSGEITEEIAKARIIKLRSEVRKPEDISLDDVSPILDVLSEDSLEKFAKEQEFSKNEALKQSQENISLKSKLSRTEMILTETETDRKRTQSELVSTLEGTLSDKKVTIEMLERIKNKGDKLASKDYKYFRIRFGVFVILSLLIPTLITLFTGIDVISVLSFSALLLPLVYLLFFEKEWKWNISLFLEKKKDQFLQKNYRDLNFDLTHLNKLRNEIKLIEDKISKLRSE